MRRLVTALSMAVVLALAVSAQRARTLTPQVSAFVSVHAPIVALTHARLIDGTGAPAKDDQTIVFVDDKITAVGRSGDIPLPPGAEVVDLTGRTVIPGLIGLHDHMYYSSAAGGAMKLMLQSYPRLFLAQGVTTIRTTGSVDSYQELNLRRGIEEGTLVGPDVVVTGPYLQGSGPGPGAMHPLSGSEDARRMVKYWADEGVTWFKAYTQISRAELQAVIEEAHAHGMKVTAHLCSVGFREAVALGIDNLEHGFLTDTEFWPGKEPDRCPTVSSVEMYSKVDIEGEDVQRTIREMVKAKVPMTSTLAVMELSSPSRIPVDQRVLDALFPDASAAIAKWWESSKTQDDRAAIAILQKAMAFERSFVKSGGLLAAGADPCCASVIAGYGDQRNFELLVEAGFTAEEAVQIMTANGARVLGIADRVGTIAVGKQADLVVLTADPTKDAANIRSVATVFRKGLGFDSAKLTLSVKGQVGLR
jgi:imidazolonepropionase-like amidohydrolase